MKQAQFEYKCRRCGVIHTSGFPTDLDNAGSLLADAVFQNKSNAPSMKTMHVCSADAYGVSDLIGFSARDCQFVQ